MDLSKKLSTLSIAPEKRKATSPLKDFKKNIKKPKKDLNITKARPQKTKADHQEELDKDRSTKKSKQDLEISFQACDQENRDENSPYIDFDDYLPEGSPDLVKVSFIKNSIIVVFKIQHSDETFEISTKRFHLFMPKIRHIKILSGSFINSMTIILTLEDDEKKDHKLHYQDIDISPFMAKVSQPKSKADARNV